MVVVHREIPNTRLAQHCDHAGDFPVSMHWTVMEIRGRQDPFQKNTNPEIITGWGENVFFIPTVMF
jgi:hypothetical protein